MSQDNNKGFTLIELMLAMSFIAGLLIAIAITSIQISGIYTRGVTMREVNQAGRSVSDSLQRSIASSAPFDVTPKSDDSPATADSKYVVQDGGGRLCLGSYSYVWNDFNGLNRGAAAPNKYSDNVTVVRFAKVADAGGTMCSSLTSRPVRAMSSELLESGDRDLVVRSFSIVAGATDPTTDQALYALSLVIGTNSGDESIVTADANCKAPSESSGFTNYCAVNRFDIIARAGNRAEGER